jgi:hypothetical protein
MEAATAVRSLLTIVVAAPALLPVPVADCVQVFPDSVHQSEQN